MSVLITGMAELVTDDHGRGLAERSHSLPIDPYEDGPIDFRLAQETREFTLSRTPAGR